MGDSDQTMITRVYNSIKNEEVMQDAADKVISGLKSYTDTVKKNIA